MQESEWPVTVCVLGSFRLLRFDRAVAVPNGGKLETLLSTLALERNCGAARESLLVALWPESDSALAGSSLNSLVHRVNKLLTTGCESTPLIRTDGGYYRLNAESGVTTDINRFEALVRIGDRRAHGGDSAGAMDAYTRAMLLYRGDVCCGRDVRSVIERERLRTLHLNLLAWVAEFHFSKGDYRAAIESALRLLADEPCREDAHRLVMRAFERSGQRAQALRQYRLCEQILRSEFDAAPEPSTRALFQQIRLGLLSA